MAGARQEGGAHAVGGLAEPEVEAGGLDLVVVERPGARKRAGLEQRGDVAIGKDSSGAQAACLLPPTIPDAAN